MDYFLLGRHPMPAHWAWILPKSITSLPFPTENRATCSSCPSKLNRYHHKSRCCTHRPQISNFLTGLALKNNYLDSEKFTSMVKKGFFLPLASLDTPMMMEWQETTSQENLKSCSYWKENFGCTIHKFRNHTCSTFFCFSMAGPDHDFWNDLQYYVMMLENNISWWLLEQTGFDPRYFLKSLKKIDRQSEHLMAWNEQCLSEIWQHWLGKEKEFFVRCAELVESNKDSLYDIATGYLEAENKKYDDIFNLYQLEHDTHFPAKKSEIIELENILIDTINQLQDLSTIDNQRVVLAQGVTQKSPEQVPALASSYPTAWKFLVLSDSQGNEIDFEPFEQTKWQEFQSILEGKEDKKKNRDLLIGGLKLRNFLK